eukprot:gene22218-26362_t
MSIGARGKDILMQFLIEAVLISITGGVMGVLLGVTSAYLISYFLSWPILISQSSIVISFVVCGITGIFFGYYPAQKASRLDPIEALRKSWKREMVLNFSNKYIRVTVHILVWMVLLALPYVINSNRSTPPHRLDPGEQGQFLKLNLISYFYLIGVFYLNGFVLIQKLFYRHSVDFEWTRAAWFNLPAFLLTIAASTTYIMIYDRIKMEKVDMERERETMKTELSFLRSQISPHFIFNILNNIVALVRLKSVDLEPTVMKLSGLMQYMLYETDEEKVSLKTEQEYLNSYIDLQKQRFGKKVKVETEIELANENQEIEPMLLIPFVEN